MINLITWQHPCIGLKLILFKFILSRRKIWKSVGYLASFSAPPPPLGSGDPVIIKIYLCFHFKVNLLTPTVNANLTNIEIRIGYEKITKFSGPLSDRNKICASIENLDSENGIFTINCTEEIMGRFLSIQKMTATPGRLELLSVKTLPEPSKDSNIKKELHLMQ